MVGGSVPRRAAIVAVVAVVAVAAVGPTAAATGQSSATVQLAYVNKASDKVGPGSQAKPDGRPDGHFRLTVAANDTITAIILRTADASGKPCCGQVWNTLPNDSLWILGVFRSGTQLNPVDKNISDPVAGSVTYDIYGSDTGFFKPGQHFVVSVTFASGSSISAVTQIAPSGGTAPPATGTSTGTVLVNNQPFTAGPIPYGSTVDVTNGSLNMSTEAGDLTVYSGGGGITSKFELVRATSGKLKVVELRLVGGNFSSCGKRTLAAGATPPKPIRRLWGKGKGHFRTQGRYSTASVNGTNWLTEDRCDGTRTFVSAGVVSVYDHVKKKTVTVRPGQSYLARRP